ncbi:bacteriophage lambda head decoration D family protein [Escherichia coli DEC4A]|nr:bacteriophage lambda head decoration D family protein [Escherichia coli DEC4A]
MTSKETFTHYQPLGNSDPAHTATAPGGLSAKAPAMTPLMLDTSSRKLVAWDGTTDGAAVGILAVAADQTSTTLTFYKSGTSVMRMCSGRRLPATRRKNGPRLPERQSASFNLTLHH